VPVPARRRHQASERMPASEISSTFVDLFLAATEVGDPERPLIYFENEVWSYRRLSQMGMAVAEQLIRLGFGRGDRIATVMPTTPDLFALLLALSVIGASFVPLIPESSPSEFEYLLGHCKPAGLIVDGALWPSVARSARHAGRVLVVADLPPTEIWLDELVRLSLAPGRDVIAASAAHCTPDDELTVMYTSGSSGRPKGVILSHRSCVAVGLLASRHLDLRPEDVVVGVLPLHHFGGLKMLSYALACGGALMVQRRFSRTRFWRDVRFSGATVGVLMPAMMAMLLTNDPNPDDRNHSLQTVISHTVNREFEERFGVEVITTWGQSELAGTGTLMRRGEVDKPLGCVGALLDPRIEIELRDDAGEPLSIGEVGQIFCRHPWVMKGYLNDAHETARSIIDGWVATGDLGHVDEHGRLFYDGRKKNMIKRSGENISGAEIESTLEEHPAVAECVAFGVPDPIRTEELKVVVALRPGAAVSEVELAQWCAERLASFKVPRYIEIRQELPRLTTLKPDRLRLLQEHDLSRGWDREEHLG
jgi:crotonobetaine/carnitine-CoA ligase